MSLEHVVKDINLVGEQLFDHTAIIRKEVGRIYDSFEKNERFKEFDGLIRASHALIEANDASLDSLISEEELKKLTYELKEITQAITQLSDPLHKKEHDDYLGTIKKQQDEQIRVVKVEVERQIQKLKDEHIKDRTGQSVSSFDASAASEIDLS